MKPLELMRLWSDFQAAMNDSKLSDEQKTLVGEEAIASLPPSMICVHSQNTRALVESLMRKELEKYGKPKATPKEEQAEIRPGKREGSEVRKVRGKQPVQPFVQD